MAEMVRLTVACLLEHAADLVDILNGSDLVQSVTQSDDEPTENDPAAKLAAALGTVKRAPSARKAIPGAIRPTGRNIVKRTSLGGKRVVYSTVGASKKLDALLESMRPKTLAAFILRDVRKHAGSPKSAIIARAVKAGYEAESVDNAVWNLQKRADRDGVGIVSEAAE